MQNSRANEGFTLIELSIVLVIIGLIVGGILVGQSLINAAAVRAQVTQIERYNTAVNTFRNKFNDIPGDLTPAAAATFGFTYPPPVVKPAPDGLAGAGDGNFVIDGCAGNAETQFQLSQACGETAWFWVNLTDPVSGNLIEGSFTKGSSTTSLSIISGTTLLQYFPQAKIGGTNYVYVFESGSINYFGITNIKDISLSNIMVSSPGMTVAQAYAIDVKMDDGLPTTGNVVARYVNGGAIDTAPATSSPPAATDCYDSAALTYAINTSGGTGVNCALSFRFQ